MDEYFTDWTSLIQRLDKDIQLLKTSGCRLSGKSHKALQNSISECKKLSRLILHDVVTTLDPMERKIRSERYHHYSEKLKQMEQDLDHLIESGVNGPINEVFYQQGDSLAMLDNTQHLVNKTTEIGVEAVSRLREQGSKLECLSPKLERVQHKIQETRGLVKSLLGSLVHDKIVISLGLLLLLTALAILGLHIYKVNRPPPRFIPYS